MHDAICDMQFVRLDQWACSQATFTTTDIIFPKRIDFVKSKNTKHFVVILFCPEHFQFFFEYPYGVILGWTKSPELGFHSAGEARSTRGDQWLGNWVLEAS